jgi:endoglucanase
VTEPPPVTGPTRRRLLQWAPALAPMATAHAQTPAPHPAWRDWSRGAWRGFTTDNVPKLSAPALNAMRATGARLARVGLPFDDDCSGCGRPAASAVNLRALHEVLDHAQRIGVGVVVLGDFERGVERPLLWTSPPLQDGFVQAWAAFAHRLGQHPALAGLDLLNEPNPPMTDGRLASAQAQWRNLAQRAIAAIRQTGCQAPVVFEPVAGGNVLGLRGLQPLDDRSVVYSIHFYTPHEITHQQVSPAYPRRIPYPAGAEWQLGGWDPELGAGPINAQRLAAELRVGLEFQRLHGLPLYVGEFGCARWAPDGSALRWVRDCLSLFQAYGWSYSFHSFRTWPGWDPEIDSEDPQARARSTDAPLMQLLRQAFAQAPRRL